MCDDLSTVWMINLIKENCSFIFFYHVKFAENQIKYLYILEFVFNWSFKYLLISIKKSFLFIIVLIHPSYQYRFQEVSFFNSTRLIKRSLFQLYLLVSIFKLLFLFVLRNRYVFLEQTVDLIYDNCYLSMINLFTRVIF